MIAEGWEIETEMAQLLDELTGIQTRLLDVLRAKRSAMSHGDLVSQRNLQTEEEAIYCALQDVQRRRGELLDRIRETGLSIDSLSEVPQHLENPVKENLSRKLGEATSLGRTVRLEQLTHWVVAQRSLPRYGHLFSHPTLCSLTLLLLHHTSQIRSVRTPLHLYICRSI